MLYIVNRKGNTSNMDYEMIFLLVGVAVIIGIKIYVAYQKTKPEKSSKKVHKNT